MTAIRTNLLFSWLLLFWLDAVVSYFGLRYLGATELNPILMPIAQYGLFPAIILVKAIGAVIFIGIFSQLRDKLAVPVLAVLLGVYVAIVLWNMTVIVST